MFKQKGPKKNDEHEEEEEEDKNYETNERNGVIVWLQNFKFEKKCDFWCPTCLVSSQMCLSVVSNILGQNTKNYSSVSEKFL